MSANAPTLSDAKVSERFKLRDRVALWFITWAAYLVIRLVGPTLRFQHSVEEGGRDIPVPEPAVYVFWHRAVFAACYRWRNLGLAVMTSSSFDGEYIARIIEKFGFKAVRGSSTRGGARALLEMRTLVEAGTS